MTRTVETSASYRAPADNVKDRVYRSLRSDILSGVFDMGERLNESQLAARYGASKTPVREALGVLTQEGLIEVQPRKGYLTSRTTLQDVQDIFELRLILEAAAVEKAADRISEETLDYLEGLSSSFWPQEADNYLLRLEYNVVFHRTIAEAAGNRRMVEVITRLLEEMQRLLLLRMDITRGSEELLEEHRQVLAALRDRDPIRAREVTVRSIVSTREVVLQSLMKRMAGWHL